MVTIPHWMTVRADRAGAGPVLFARVAVSFLEIASASSCSPFKSCPHSCRSLKTSTILLRGKTQTELGLRASSVFERDLQPDGPRRRVEEKLAGLVPKERRCRIHIRSEELRVGKDCVSKCRSRWSPDLKKQT